MQVLSKAILALSLEPDSETTIEGIQKVTNKIIEGYFIIVTTKPNKKRPGKVLSGTSYWTTIKLDSGGKKNLKKAKHNLNITKTPY